MVLSNRVPCALVPELFGIGRVVVSACTGAFCLPCAIAWCKGRATEGSIQRESGSQREREMRQSCSATPDASPQSCPGLSVLPLPCDLSWGWRSWGFDSGKAEYF